MSARNQLNTPFGTQETSLTPKDALHLLENATLENLSSYPAVKPKGGEMFFVYTNGDSTKISKFNFYIHCEYYIHCQYCLIVNII